MLTAPTERPVSVTPDPRWHAEWLAHVGPRTDAGAATPRWPGANVELTISGTKGSDLRVAESLRYVVVFSGALVNAAELDPRATDRDAAALVLGLFEKAGWRAFEPLRGPFVVLVWDRDLETLHVARDHVGLEPIFYARSGRDWWFVTLTRRAGGPGARVARLRRRRAERMAVRLVSSHRGHRVPRREARAARVRVERTRDAAQVAQVLGAVSGRRAGFIPAGGRARRLRADAVARSRSDVAVSVNRQFC